jgi:rhodanese-related sulfurtransferase
LEELPEGKPVVFVCRSGARSAQACVILGKRKSAMSVASLPGGLMRWNREGRVVEEK